MLRIIFISILLIFTANATVKGADKHELEEMVDFVDEQNLKIKDWQVVVKEKKDQLDIEKIINEFENSYKVTRTEDENIIKYQIRDAHKGYDFNVLYNVVLPKDKVTYPEITVAIKGENWNQEISSDFQLVKDSITDNFFTKSKKTFSWLSTEASGIISKGEFEVELTNYFNIQHKDTQIDSLSTSVQNKYIYGYTPQWSEKVNIENTPINVQIAITKNEKGLPEMTLGTPILIHEY